MFELFIIAQSLIPIPDNGYPPPGIYPQQQIPQQVIPQPVPAAPAIPLSERHQGESTSQRISGYDDPALAKVTFTFKSVYEFNNCMDALLLYFEANETSLQKVDQTCLATILQAYNGQLDRRQAIGVVHFALQYAENLLRVEMTPALGIRRRLARELSYTFPIDANDSLIQQFATQAKMKYNL